MSRGVTGIPRMKNEEMVILNSPPRPLVFLEPPPPTFSQAHPAQKCQTYTGHTGIYC